MSRKVVFYQRKFLDKTSSVDAIEAEVVKYEYKGSDGQKVDQGISGSVIITDGRNSISFYIESGEEVKEQTIESVDTLISVLTSFKAKMNQELKKLDVAKKSS